MLKFVLVSNVIFFFFVIVGVEFFPSIGRDIFGSGIAWKRFELEQGSQRKYKVDDDTVFVVDLT